MYFSNPLSLSWLLINLARDMLWKRQTVLMNGFACLISIPINKKFSLKCLKADCTMGILLKQKSQKDHYWILCKRAMRYQGGECSTLNGESFFSSPWSAAAVREHADILQDSPLGFHGLFPSESTNRVHPQSDGAGMSSVYRTACL